MAKNLVLNSEDIKTLEQYGTAVLVAMISIASLEKYEHAAFKAGLLNASEEETSKTVCWELRRLMSLYTTQIKQISERCELDQAQVIKAIQQLYESKPPVKRQRKPKVVE